MNTDYSELIYKFRHLGDFIRNSILPQYGNIRFLPEESSTNFGQEFIYDLTLMERLDEEDYGLAVGFVILGKKKGQQRLFELYVIRGNGSYLYSYEFSVDESASPISIPIEEFQIALDKCKAVIQDSLDNDYSYDG